jgi:EAL domain-containing protein (putative c-di-GMP-specific phosphodiesterase class I)
MVSDLDALLAQGTLQVLFQPIIDGVLRRPIGYEALARGPAGSPLHLPDALFAAAHGADRCLDLERACIMAALHGFATLQIEGRLFINVLPRTLLHWPDFSAWLAERLSTLELDPHQLVIELTEHGLTEDQGRLIEAVDPLRRLGCDIALDDLGAGASGLKTWSAVRPEYVKVDRYFVSGIEHDPVRGEILRSVVDMARAIGCRVIAEGVENAAQCTLALELGVDHVQGYCWGARRRCHAWTALASSPWIGWRPLLPWIAPNTWRCLCRMCRTRRRSGRWWRCFACTPPAPRWP